MNYYDTLDSWLKYFHYDLDSLRFHNIFYNKNKVIKIELLTIKLFLLI